MFFYGRMIFIREDYMIKHKKSVALLISILLIILLVGCDASKITLKGNNQIISDTTNKRIDDGDSINISNTVLGNSLANIKNGGLVARNEDWIYYSNTSEDWNLYKVKDDGTQKTKLTDYAVIFVNVVDDYIYYSDYVFAETSCILKIKTDGTNQSIITEEPAYGVIVINDWIYYANSYDNLVYKIRTDGSEKVKLLNTRVNGFIVHDGHIYYKDFKDGMIYKKEIGKETHTALIKKEVKTFVLADNWIYYTSLDNGDNLYKVTINGESDTRLADVKFGYSYNIKDDWIYYSNESDYGRLYKINTDGKGNIKLSDDDVSDINIIDEWVYYLNLSEGKKIYRIRIDGTQRQLVE
jgi:hypothetical protein